MIGLRLAITGDQFAHVHGLLHDEAALTPDVEFMASGGNELIVDEAAFERLDADLRSEIARFIRPGSDVVVSQPAAGGDPDMTPVAAVAESPRRGRSTRSTTKGA